MESSKGFFRGSNGVHYSLHRRLEFVSILLDVFPNQRGDVEGKKVGKKRIFR